MKTTRPQDVPSAEHFAVLVFSSESVTRTEEPWTPRPGMGATTYTETTEKIEYFAFNTEAKLCEWLRNVNDERLSSTRRVILRVAGQLTATVKLEVSVK